MPKYTLVTFKAVTKLLPRQGNVAFGVPWPPVNTSTAEMKFTQLLTIGGNVNYSINVADLAWWRRDDNSMLGHQIVPSDVESGYPRATIAAFICSTSPTM